MIASLLCISVVISAGFMWMGAWVIAPFAGVEIGLLAASLYYVSWKLSYCHVIVWDCTMIVIEKGVYYPKKCWQLRRDHTQFFVETPRHQWDGPLIRCVSRQHDIDIGEFLNKPDRLKLLTALRQSGLPIKYSEITQQDA